MIRPLVLLRVLRRADFSVTWNQAFPRVLRECGAGRSEGTWLVPEMIAAYERLHRAGHAFSVEEFRRPEYEVRAVVSEGPHVLGRRAIAISGDTNPCQGLLN